MGNTLLSLWSITCQASIPHFFGPPTSLITLDMNSSSAVGVRLENLVSNPITPSVISLSASLTSFAVSR
jgi:hypothetical protein